MSLRSKWIYYCDAALPTATNPVDECAYSSGFSPNTERAMEWALALGWSLSGDGKSYCPGCARRIASMPAIKGVEP